MHPIPSFVQVRDLPSAASFYSAITQPLKLRYISANSSSITFGDASSSTPDPVLEVRRVGAGQSLRPSRVVLTAQSPSVVSAFRAAVQRADPDVQIDTHSDGSVEVTDFDGNVIEVSCSPGRSGSAYARSTVTSLASRDPRTTIRRSATTSTIETPQRESPRGVTASNGAGFGTVLGAAAVGVAVGSALTYAFMRGDRQRAPRQDYDAQAIALQRRASYPDPQPAVQPRYLEDSSSKKYPPLSYGARYAQIEAPPRSRAAEDLDDRASRHTSQYSSRSRRRSEASTARRPLMISDAEYVSSAGSKHHGGGGGQKLIMDAEYRSQAAGGGEDDRRSYAQSRYTTAPPPSKHGAASRGSSRHRPPEAETYVSTRSRKPASMARGAEPRSRSRLSARDLELPESHVAWDEDLADDDDDLAPSDSISCVGDEGYTRRPQRRGSHAGATPSMVGRYRRVVNEFDGKRRPLYGSEYN